MKNFRVRRIHIVCLAIATAEILIAAFVLWKNAIWNETQIQTANQQSVLSETQEETTSDIQENEKTATQNQEETKPTEEAVSSMPSMRVKLKNSDNTSFEHAKVIITCPDTVWHKGADFYRRTDCYYYTGASVFSGRIDSCGIGGRLRYN